MEQTFLPAWVWDNIIQFRRLQAKVEGRTGNVNPYDLLISYHYWKRYFQRYPDDPMGHYSSDPDYLGTVFGDSGGFSLVTLDAKIDPERLIRWQMNYCTRGVFLDIPPYRRSSHYVWSNDAIEYWKDAIDRTELNVKRAAPHYIQAKKGKNPTKFEWWGVVQGETRDQMQEWYDRMANVYPFDGPTEGWAMKPHPALDPVVCARTVRFAVDNNLPRLHFLQVNSPPNVVVILALSLLAGNIELVTYDSASVSLAAGNRHLMVGSDERGFNYKHQFTRDGNTDVVDHMWSGDCGCDACTWFQEDYPDGEFETSVLYYMMLHNFYLARNYFQNVLFEQVKADPVGMLKSALGKHYGPVMREYENPKIWTQYRPITIFEQMKKQR